MSLGLHLKQKLIHPGQNPEKEFFRGKRERDGKLSIYIYPNVYSIEEQRTLVNVYSIKFFKVKKLDKKKKTKKQK
jgi:hypothetical protein